MSHLYIHIPFCATKCPYCDFFSLATQKWHSDFSQALEIESKLRSKECRDSLRTIYFGGGTPSFPETTELELMLSAVRKHFSVSQEAEITIEANPDDINSEKLQEWLAMGINRLSIGVQSFLDADLQYLGRRHDASKAQKAINEAQKAGFSNISIDFIHGIPGSTVESMMQNIEMAAKMRVQHLSMYSLTVEEGTILSKHIAQGKTANIVEDFQAELYIKSCEKAEEVGFAQYEVSNFCVPGYESVHNSAYWNGASYIGLGPSAHSFDGKSRRWNKSDLIAYIKGAEKGKIPFDSEKLSSIDKYNEYLLTRLRLLEGISLRDMEKQFGAEALAQFRGDIAKNKYQEFFVMENNSLSLSRSGLLLADGIIASLMKG